MNKLISIAIPTLNRRELLKFTLSHFITQIEPVKDEVELVVCNNASEDGTVSMISPVGIDGITNKTFSYEQGTNIVLKPKATKGYVFDHWEVTEDNNTVKVTDTTLNRNLEAKAISFKAVFKPNVLNEF